MKKKEFYKLRNDLHKHHILGEGNAYTHAPIYLARVEEIVWGFEEDYAELHTLGYSNWEGEGYNSVQEFVDSHEDEEWDYTFGLSDYPNKEFFLAR